MLRRNISGNIFLLGTAFCPVLLHRQVLRSSKKRRLHRIDPVCVHARCRRRQGKLHATLVQSLARTAYS